MNDRQLQAVMFSAVAIGAILLYWYTRNGGAIQIAPAVMPATPTAVANTPANFPIATFPVQAAPKVYPVTPYGAPNPFHMDQSGGCGCMSWCGTIV